MYLKRGVYEYRLKKKVLREVVDHVSKANNKKKAFVYFDVIISSFLFGSMYTEYEALDFINRSYKNRSSFVTKFWLARILKKYNLPSKRHYFSEKRDFNEAFSSYICRDTINLLKAKNNDLVSFLKNKDKIVIKKSDGASGKQVFVKSISGMTMDEKIQLIKESGCDVIEEYVTNADAIYKLNPTSLNTIRIVTVHDENSCNYVCACLRIGATGFEVDNVSCGGTSADIDLETGRIRTLFFCNKYKRNEMSQVGRNEIGLEIPFWHETLEMISSASKVIKGIHIVGWDVAITPKGPVLIEGNDAFGTTVMQFYKKPNEKGLKRRFKECLSKISVNCNS